ncbi:MAG: hypothetical protein ETSY1_44905, partial [Candidatus Entotheonella factor]
MSLVSRSPAEAQLAELIEHFDHWRQTRTTRGEPIPEPLWEQAVSLTQVLPLSRVARRLRLNRQDLKKRCGQSRPPQSASPPAVPIPDFIEVKPETAWIASGMELDLERPDGTRLHIHYHEPQPPLAAV